MNLEILQPIKIMSVIAFKPAARTAIRAVSRIPLLRRAVKPLTMAGIVPSPIWKRIPVEEVFQVNIGNTFFRYASCFGDDLGRALYWKGIAGYESETIAVFCSIAQQARVVIDVGACTGVYSLVALASSPKCRVIAFEPVIAVRERCKLNIAINNWSDRCTIRTECVSDTCAPRKFHVCGAGSELVSSSSLNVNGFHNIRGRLIDVQCTTLDLATPVDAAVDLVKIDVEGFESSVIKGMKRIMTEYRPDIILEVSDETQEEDAQECLTGAGYSLYHLRASGPVPVSRMVADTTFRNYLARHRSRVVNRG